MTQITIPVQVVNGHLQHEINLAELEGRRILATLTIEPTELTSGNRASEPQAPVESAHPEPEPPDWLEIENDVYFPIKRPAKSLGKVKVRKRRGKPCIILPEELPDE